MRTKILHMLPPIGACICIVMGLLLASCGNDEKEEPDVLSPFNAKGVFIMYFTDELEMEDIYLWINDYSIYTYLWNGEKELNLEHTTNSAIDYRPLTMDSFFDLLSEDWGREVNENTDFTNYEPNPTKLIQYVKSNKSKYKYIALRNGDYLLFNRTSNVNY